MTWNDEALAELRRQHPAWEIWRVDRYPGGTVWCARPCGQDKPVLNAYQPAHLSQYIAGCQDGRPQPASCGGPAPYEEAARRLHAVAAGLAAHGMTTHLHDSRYSLDLTARFCAPGERETEIVLDEDGYAEVRFWIHAGAEPDEITALALRVFAAVTGTTLQAQSAPPAPGPTASQPQSLA